MLQISTGKFFKHEAHETMRRAIFYTNYRLFRNEVLDTQVGSLQAVAGVHGLAALTCELIERIQKHPDGPHSGEVVATSGDTLINDFAAIASFALGITCTTDLDLARRLVASERPSLGADLVPQKHIPRMFDRIVNWDRNDRDRLQRFVADLMAMERKSYEGAMRAIRRYVVGTYRISDDVNLSYALFVMSMESLAQEFDKFAPTWADYDQNKRRRIDDALGMAPEPVANDVRAAILANEHVAITRRFREFALAHTGPSFFREEAVDIARPISRPDLSTALQQAYSIRSGYVHHLRDIPRIVSAIEGYHETVMVEGKPVLTFAGIARVARHVINTFIARAPKTEKEEFDWMKDLPGTIQMEWAAEYWLSDPRGFDAKSAPKYLAAYIQQVVGRFLQPTAPLNDIRQVLAKVETLVAGLAKPRQRLPLLALYFIFNFHAPDDYRSQQYPALIETYQADFEAPSFVSLAALLVTGQDPDWTLPEMEALHARYFRERHHAETLDLGRLLEAAFTLRLAEQNRAAGNTTRARELVAFAVDVYPEHAGLRSFEATITSEELGDVVWQTLLIPALSQPG